jgi:ABC-type transport system substrate-binding protein
MTDWPLDQNNYDRFIFNPDINISGYGAEFRFFMLDLNNNNNQYLGNPPNPSYPNPVYPNPMSVLEMRKAIAYLVNRDQICAMIGHSFCIPEYTPVPASINAYQHPDIKPGGALESLCYLYNPATANAILDAGGFPIGPDGWRYWDRNHNGIKDVDENLNLIIISRIDDSGLEYSAESLYMKLTNAKIHCNLQQLSKNAAMIQVMEDKNFHIYTGEWPFDVDPDYLIEWNSNYYWHPGVPKNYAGVNDTVLNGKSYGVKYAKTFSDAVTNAYGFQERFATIVASIPLWSYSGYKAMSKNYVGPEVPYTGLPWEGVYNMQGYGFDNDFSFLRMHPDGYLNGNEMTVRWGFSNSFMQNFNPVYSNSQPNWWYDIWKILKEIFEELLKRFPFNLGIFKSWLAESFEVGTYVHPKYGSVSKVNFTLRPDITWQDGTPLTTADVYFTLVELPKIISARGLPPLPWMSNVENILDFRITDPYNFEVLFNNMSIYAPSWLSRQVILPMHIWKPIVSTGDPTDFAPDPNMIGSGAWRLQEYVPGSHIIMAPNTKGSTIQTNLPGSNPITSPKGYWDSNPITSYITLEIKADGTTKAKIDYNTQPHTVYYTINNNYDKQITGDVNIKLPDGSTTTTNIAIPPMTSWMHIWTGNIKGKKTTSITIGVTQPSELVGSYSYDKIFWGTIREDITGSTYYDDIGLSTYPYKSKLPSPDCKVDAKDVALASSTFGSYPGHPKWNPIVDITGDYKIDARDVAAIASKFGWRC